MLLDPLEPLGDLATLRLGGVRSLAGGLRLVALVTHGLEVRRGVVVAMSDVVNLGGDDLAPGTVEAASALVVAPVVSKHLGPDLGPVRREAISPTGVLPVRHGVDASLQV